MTEASAEALARCGKSPDDIDLVVPHEANLRILEFVAKKAAIPMDRVFLTDFDRDVVERLRRLPDAARTQEEQAAVARGTTLDAPAAQAAVDALAARIGKPLPPSYRDFLASSNGMLFEGADRLGALAVRCSPACGAPVRSSGCRGR